MLKIEDLHVEEKVLEGLVIATLKPACEPEEIVGLAGQRIGMSTRQSFHCGGEMRGRFLKFTTLQGLSTQSDIAA